MPPEGAPARAAAAAPVPLTSTIFGYGPMLPLVAAALASLVAPHPWPYVVRDLAIFWAALILAFVAGVRRGHAFGDPHASTAVAIFTMLVYFVPAGLSLLLAWTGRYTQALALLAASYAMVALLDWHAARTGNAPAHFATLRPPQMAIAAASLALLLILRLARLS